ncbi:Hypothetical predicted protein [Octopus vulgaris]|uniref:Uncharacterized protein n=1 Tax=Octopus vulgaris TaxID=6645 RepID=A0AA36BJ61_OCTVU|nr:Hypothetical predicted protein [Octopus vulgaris]
MFPCVCGGGRGGGGSGGGSCSGGSSSDGSNDYGVGRRDGGCTGMLLFQLNFETPVSICCRSVKVVGHICL